MPRPSQPSVRAPLDPRLVEVSNRLLTKLEARPALHIWAGEHIVEVKSWIDAAIAQRLPKEGSAPAADTAWEAELTRLQKQVREVDSTRSAIQGRLKAWDRVGGPDRSHKKSMTEYRALEQQLQSATKQYYAAYDALKAHKAKRPA